VFFLFIKVWLQACLALAKLPSLGRYSYVTLTFKLIRTGQRGRLLCPKELVFRRKEVSNWMVNAPEA